MPISQKRSEANRRNALKSSGPVTARGRAVSSQNARKHTILPFENPALPAQLTAQHYGHFVPADKIERRLVEKVIHADRLRRYSTLIGDRIHSGQVSDTDLPTMLEALASASGDPMISFEMAAAERDCYNALRQLEALRKKAA